MICILISCLKTHLDWLYHAEWSAVYIPFSGEKMKCFVQWHDTSAVSQLAARHDFYSLKFLGLGLAQSFFREQCEPVRKYRHENDFHEVVGP